ncbi:MAG TPA: polyprenyl synthetase family protein, partial [bacterium]|nr:polyprenyl synthetase family protein [bacterium]
MSRKELHTIDSKAFITELRQKVNRRLLEIARSYDDPQSLYRPIEYVLDGGGKRIRPILTLLANHAFQGPEQAALNAAVSLEMLHNFTLVHDDIMDEDYQRRGKPTVHTKWDVSTAILSGDNLLALAYKVLLRVRSDNLHQILDIYTDGLVDICE